MRVIATKMFEGIRDAERNVYPKEGDIWEVEQERAEYLESKGVVEIIKEEKEELNEFGNPVGTRELKEVKIERTILPEVKSKKKKSKK